MCEKHGVRTCAWGVLVLAFEFGTKQWFSFLIVPHFLSGSILRLYCVTALLSQFTISFATNHCTQSSGRKKKNDPRRRRLQWNSHPSRKKQTSMEPEFTDINKSDTSQQYGSAHSSASCRVCVVKLETALSFSISIQLTCVCCESLTRWVVGCSLIGSRKHRLSFHLAVDCCNRSLIGEFKVGISCCVVSPLICLFVQLRHLYFFCLNKVRCNQNAFITSH